MTRLLIIDGRPEPGELLGGLGGVLGVCPPEENRPVERSAATHRRAAERRFDEFRAEGLSVVPTHDDRAGVAIVHGGGSGLLTVDLALPGLAGYRCVTALGGGSFDVPILAIHEAILHPFRLAHITGWPSTLGLPPREFDRLMSVVRRCGRLTTQPERQYLLNVRVVGFLVAGGVTPDEQGAYSDEWHAMQLAIARDATLEHRAIA